MLPEPDPKVWTTCPVTSAKKTECPILRFLGGGTPLPRLERGRAQKFSTSGTKRTENVKRGNASRDEQRDRFRTDHENLSWRGNSCESRRMRAREIAERIVMDEHVLGMM